MSTLLARGLAANLALLSLSACSDDGQGTHVVVVIDAEPQIKARAKTGKLAVQTLGESTQLAFLRSYPPSEWHFPFVVDLVPKAEASRPFLLEVTALDGDVALAYATFSSSYLPGQTRYVKLVLEDLCSNVPSCTQTCTDRSAEVCARTCHQGSCVPASYAPESLASDEASAVPSVTLAQDRPDAATSDAGSAATSDAGSAATSDAGSAATSDAGTVTPVPDAGTPVPAGPCAGEHTGTWHGTTIPDTLTLLATCALEYSGGDNVCSSAGTYTVNSTLESIELIVTSTTGGVYESSDGTSYQCLPPKGAPYECEYRVQPDPVYGQRLRYRCDGSMTWIEYGR
jgi:hypothetical protein